MTRRTALLALAAVLLAPAALAAHDGHAHKVRGVVTQLSATQLEVKGTDGTVLVIALTPATKLLRGTMKVALADVKPGDRVVVNVGNGKAPLTAKDVQVGVRETSK